MADKPAPPAAAPPAQQARVGPSVTHAAKLALTYGSVDFMISFATARVVIDPATGQPGQHQALEWVASVGMSPTLADQLHTILAAALEDYRTKFGAIPKDPNFKMQKTANK